ncbi:MAG: tRNA (guanosine(46)-N7)-methyltransferase TrmB [Alphaproteobacteria bacterium]
MLDETLPGLRVALPEAGERLEPGRLFADGRTDIWLEIGFGGGEHLAAQARAHPGIGFIGCEPFVNGVVSLLGHVARHRLVNLRVLDDDALPLIDALPDACLGRVFVLFPDPWPKKRHHKRRFIDRANLDRLARVMADGAELRLASDDMDYARWMLERCRAHDAFDWRAKGPEDWRARPPDWPATRYENKAARAGRQSLFLTFTRHPRRGQTP